MAHNLVHNYPDLVELFDRSTWDWLSYDDIHLIFALRNHLPLSTSPAPPSEDALYLYRDVFDDVFEWDVFDDGKIVRRKVLKGEFPIDYHLSRRVLAPRIEGATTIYEKRVYQAIDKYGEFSLAHYRVIDVVESEEDTDESIESSHGSSSGDGGDNNLLLEENEDEGAGDTDDAEETETDTDDDDGFFGAFAGDPPDVAPAAATSMTAGNKIVQEAQCSKSSHGAVSNTRIIPVSSSLDSNGQLLKHQNLENYFESKVPSLKEFTRTKAIANTKVPTSRLLANVMQLLERHEFLKNHGDWINTVKPAIDPVITSQVRENPELTNEEIENLNAIRNQMRVAIGSLLKDDGILVIPTMPGVPPKLGSKEIMYEDYQNRASSLLSIASISGCCQVTVSGSEDRHAKIWKDGVCVWDAKFLESGDIVTACSDGVITDQMEIDAYDYQISQYKLSRKKVGGMKLGELPGLDALTLPGTSDGQTKVVREGDNGVAYAWNMKEQRWDKIGEVVDGPDGVADRPILDGVQYDYVFDVDIGDGEPIRKLPYNRSDNPYDAADKWLLKENLPLAYRQQIVEFILQNSGDPFTGANAYVPGQASHTAATPAKPLYKHIPKKGVLVFDVAQYDGILKRMTEFNNTLRSDSVNNDKSLTEVEVSRVDAIVKILKDTSHYHSTTFAEMDIALLLKVLQAWPPAMMFPATDIVRMLVLHPHGASLLIKHVENNNELLLDVIKKVTEDTALPANLLTTVRVLVNLFKNSSFHYWLQRHHSQILDAFSNCYSSPNKNLQLAYSTFYAVLLIEKKDQEGQAQVLSAALQIAEEEAGYVDSKFRSLVAIGSLMLEGLVKKIAIDFRCGEHCKSGKGI